MPETPSPVEIMVRLLARRAYTKMELRRKLYKRELFSKPQIESAICELEKKGFLNDGAYLRDAVRIHVERGRGPAYLRAKLTAKGLSRDDVDAAIRTYCAESGNAPEVHAGSLIRSRAKQFLREEDPRKRKAKILRFLAARGYSADQAFRAIDDARTEVGL